MKISKVETKLFEYTSYVESDDEGHGHPAKNPRKVSQCMVIIETCLLYTSDAADE